MEKNKLRFYWAGLFVAAVMAFGIVIFAGCSNNASVKKVSKAVSVCEMPEAFI